MYEQACKDQNLDDVLRYGELYVNMGGEDKVADVVYTISKVYAWKNDTVKVNYWYEYLKQYSEENDGLLDEELVRLQHDTQELMDIKKWESEVVDCWVNIEDIYSNFSPMILSIINLAEPIDGAILFLNNQNIEKADDELVGYYLFRRINVSQGVFSNGRNKKIVLRFASETLNDNTWKTDIASIGIEATQDLRSNFDATILTSDGTFGEKLGATLATGLLTAGLESIFRNMTYSYHTFDCYNFLVKQKNNNVLDATITHWHKYVDNSGHNYESKKDNEAIFVRWEEEDSVVFVAPNFNVLTLNPILPNDPLLDEYNSIMRKTSFWNPKYCIPTFAGIAMGGLLGYLGIVLAFNDDLIGWGCSLFAVGFTTVISLPFVISRAKCPSDRTKLFEQMNHRNVEKLRRKADVELSFSPGYNPTYDAMGASVNIKF